MKRRQSFKLLSTITPIKLASNSRNERAKKITSPFRNLTGMFKYRLFILYPQNKFIYKTGLFHLNCSCWSFIGKGGGMQPLSLGDGCWSTGTVQHEFMHALGFVHEQSRPDRDQYVKINYTNIDPGNESLNLQQFLHFK